MENHSSRCDFIGGSDARIIMTDDGAAFPRLWRGIRAAVEGEDLLFGLGTKHPNRRWYQAITGGVPIGWHVAAVCYATAAFFLGWWPWNFLLLLLLFPVRNKRVRLYTFRTMAAKEAMRSRESRSRRGSSL